VSQRLKIPLPDRCVLYQALFWVSDSVRPISDTHFLSLPEPAVLGPTDEDKRSLLLALMSGRLKAKGIFWGDEDHQNHELEDKTCDLSPVFWEQGDVDWQESSLQLPDPSWVASVLDEPVATINWNLITVRTSELMEVFPDPLEPAQGITDTARTRSEQTITPAPTTKKRGRPPTYDWTAFFVEIIVRADLDGLPDSMAELERSMADWCEQTWGTQPGDSTIREKISPIYNHLRKARK